MHGGVSMISAVSNRLSFRGTEDLFNSPGKFTVQQQEIKNDSFEKRFDEDGNKKRVWIPVTVAALTALAGFVGLGYAVKKGNLKHVDVSEIEGTFSKLWTRCKNVGHSIGETADKWYSNTLGKWFGKSK